ncbi:MAG: MarR family transcriptional regulator [Frondihabitans sp.]|nr:MarR family transcriptional regulator [Frondihabitans sp.]
MAERATVELAARGYDDVRPTHEFALRAILAGASSASDLGRRMAVSKQAAAKMIAVLEGRRYVAREPDPADKRRMNLAVTDYGLSMLRAGEATFDTLRDEWEQQVGAESLALVEATLRQLVGDAPVRLDAPGWIARDTP